MSAELFDKDMRPAAPAELSFLVRPFPKERVEAVVAEAAAFGRVFRHEGLALAGFGTAGTIEFGNGLGAVEDATSASELLREIRPAGGTTKTDWGPVVLAALPFQKDTPARLFIPAVTIVVERSTEPIVLVVGAPAELERLETSFPFVEQKERVQRPSPDRFELFSVRGHGDYLDLVDEARRAIAAGELEKVVLAREVFVRANRPFRTDELFERLVTLHPSCAAFCLDGFVGASPELLLRRIGALATSRPLAGTVARSGDPHEDERLAEELLASEKDRAEHGYVVTGILSVLGSLADEITVDPRPHLRPLRNVAHLETTISARLAPGAAPTAIELVAALHPTAAVGGFPTDAALKFLERFENLERDRYGGPVGWMRADGDGEFFLGIRSAIVSENTARLLAGAGIVAHSDPESELIETQLKLQALLATAVRP